MATQSPSDYEVIDNVSATVSDTLRGPGTGDARANYGTITTRIDSSTRGDTTTFRMNVSNGTLPPSDSTGDLSELLEYVGDMIQHWTRVQAKLAAIAATLENSPS